MACTRAGCGEINCDSPPASCKVYVLCGGKPLIPPRAVLETAQRPQGDWEDGGVSRAGSKEKRRKIVQ